MFHLREHSATHERQRAAKSCLALRFPAHTANVSLSIPSARTASRSLTTVCAAAPQMNRCTLQSFRKERVNGEHCGSPRRVPPAPAVVEVNAWIRCGRRVRPGDACPMWREAVWRCTVRPALPHGPTALPAALKETRQRSRTRRRGGRAAQRRWRAPRWQSAVSPHQNHMCRFCAWKPLGWAVCFLLNYKSLFIKQADTEQICFIQKKCFSLHNTPKKSINLAI